MKNETLKIANKCLDCGSVQEGFSHCTSCGGGRFRGVNKTEYSIEDFNMVKNVEFRIYSHKSEDLDIIVREYTGQFKFKVRVERGLDIVHKETHQTNYLSGVIASTLETLNNMEGE